RRTGRPVLIMLGWLPGLTCQLHRPRAESHRSGETGCLVVAGKTLCQSLDLFPLGSVGATGCRRSTGSHEHGAVCVMNTRPIRRCGLLERLSTWGSQSTVVVGRGVGRQLSVMLFSLPRRSLRSRSTGCRKLMLRRLRLGPH